MEENNQENQENLGEEIEEKVEETLNINTEELKKETVDTVRQVKDTVKQVDIKKDSLETKGVIVEMFKNPLGKVKEIANDDSNKHFKTAFFVVIIWILAILIKSIYTYSGYGFTFRTAFDNILDIIKDIVAPILIICVYSVIVLVMNKDSKKSLTTIITGTTIAKLPVILAEVVGLLTIISSNASTITVPFARLCSITSVILLYFITKEMFESKDDTKFIKTFILIQGIYYIAYIVIKLFGIYI